jgi:hypothetical protein
MVDDPVVQGELPLLMQLPHGDLGERLVDGPQIEAGVHAVRRVVPLAGEAMGGSEDHLTPVGDQGSS